MKNLQKLYQISEFNRETNNAKDMSKFTNFLEKTVENIVGKEEEKRLDSLFSFGETVLNKFGAKYGRL